MRRSNAKLKQDKDFYSIVHCESYQNGAFLLSAQQFSHSHDPLRWARLGAKAARFLKRFISSLGLSLTKAFQ